MKKTITISVFVLVSLISMGCLKENDQKLSGKKSISKKVEPNRVIIMALDGTGSYKNWDKAKQIAIDIVIQLEPGDVFYLRKITDESYTDSCTLFRLELPMIEKSNMENPFDRKAKKKHKLSKYRNNALKRATIERITKIKFTSAGRTDVNGMLAVASEKFKLFKKERIRILCIASDLQENVRFKPDLDLEDVKVAVVGFQPMKDPKSSQKFKEMWTKFFEKYGAKKTIFYRSDEKFNLNNI